MYKLAAKVVWSINARRSTLEQAKKIYWRQYIVVAAYLLCATNRNNCTLGDIICLLVELVSFTSVRIAGTALVRQWRSRCRMSRRAICVLRHYGRHTNCAYGSFFGESENLCNAEG